MNKKEVIEHNQRIEAVFRRCRSGWENGQLTAVTDDTSLAQLFEESFAAEEFDSETPDGAYSWPDGRAGDLELEALKLEEANKVAAFARRRFVMWLIGDGMHPYRILQRIYGVLFYSYPEFLGELNETWLAEILGQGKAAFSALIKRLFTKPTMIKTGVMMVSSGMKSVDSRKGYAANALRSLPSQKLNASALNKPAEAQAARQALKDRKEKLRRDREAWERQQLADLVGCDPSEIDPKKCQLNPNDQEP